MIDSQPPPSRIFKIKRVGYLFTLRAIWRVQSGLNHIGDKIRHQPVVWIGPLWLPIHSSKGQNRVSQCHVTTLAARLLNHQDPSSSIMGCHTLPTSGLMGIGSSYPSAQMQLVYSTAPVYRAGSDIKEKKAEMYYSYLQTLALYFTYSVFWVNGIQ